MARVELASLSLGWVTDVSGNAQGSVTPTITNASGGAATIYTAATGSSTVSPTTDTNGYMPGFVEEGTYTFSIGPLTHRVDVVAGAPLGSLNVRSFGAKGDGSANDATAIQAAITACSTAGGGVVYLPPGTYKVTSPLEHKNFVSLVGSGADSCTLRASGNVYAVNLTGANRTAIRDLTIDAAAVQSSGGGINMVAASLNARFENLYFGNNLFNSLNISGGSGIVYGRTLRWNGVTGHNTAITIGDGTTLTTDVWLSDLSGTASTTADMQTWVDVARNTDTVELTNCIFLKSTSHPVRIGAFGAGGVLTLGRFNNVIVESGATGFFLQNATDFKLTGCSANSNTTGVDVQASCRGVSWRGGAIQANTGTGVVLRSGAVFTDFDGVHIDANNQANGGFDDGVEVQAGATDFKVQNCTIGNNVRTGGHQKYGVQINAGASDRFHIEGNDLSGNDTGAFDNNATGAIQCVQGNTPWTQVGVASATTTTLPGGSVVLVSGTTTITSVTASYAGRVVTLVFSGALTFTDGSNLQLAGNFVTTGNDTITLACDGSNWYEVARSVN